MARVVKPEDLPAPAKQKPRHQDDGAILFPDLTISIRGEDIMVREYRFLESLRIAPLVQPIVDSLREAFRAKSVTIAAMRAAYAEHPQEVAELIAVSCKRSVEWVTSLPDADSEALLLTWQTVTMDFFVRRVAADFHSRQGMANALAGAMSSPPSPPTATTRSDSASTHSVN